MSEQSSRLPGHGGEEDVLDRATVEAIDNLIFAALAKSAPPPIPDGADSPATLTPEDLAALKTLGSSEELARRVCARFEGDAAGQVPTCKSTYFQDRGEEETAFDSPAIARPPDPEFKELLARHAACCRVKRFRWTRQFVREEAEIGKGGQGVVYRITCEDDFVGSRALKILFPGPYGDVRSYEEDMQRMRAVAATVHQNCHDNLIHVERFEPHKGVYVMVMRLIDGYDLDRLLQPEVVESMKRSVPEGRWADLNRIVFANCGSGRRGLAPGVAVNIIEKCLRGAHALHEKGIIHCDIRPSNIMLDCQGSIRLIDIGSAFHYKSRPRWHAWSPRYAPPEALEDNMWSPQSDLASMGYVLIELVSGQADFLGPSVSLESSHKLDRAMRADLADVKRRLPDRLGQLIPAPARNCQELMDLCLALIHPDPAKRFASAEKAIDVTAKFKDALATAKLAMPWVKVGKYWLTDAKKAMSSTDSRG